MIITNRIIHERKEFAGQDPTTRIDTLGLSPPTFEDPGPAVDKMIVVAPTDTDTEVAIPDCCSFLLVSDEPVLFRLGSGETLQTVRRVLIDGEDETAVAVEATTILLSGNETSIANVRIVYYETES